MKRIPFAILLLAGMALFFDTVVDEPEAAASSRTNSRFGQVNRKDVIDKNESHPSTKHKRNTHFITDERLAEAARAYLGRGYFLWKKPFASGENCSKLPIFDGTLEYDTLDTPQFTSETHQGQSLSQYISSFSMSADGHYKSVGAAVDIAAKFSLDTNSRYKHTYCTIVHNIIYNNITLKGTPKVNAAAQAAINTMAPIDLFVKYGTHYTRSLNIGASLWVFMKADRSKVTSVLKGEASVRAEKTLTPQEKIEATGKTTSNKKRKKPAAKKEGEKEKEDPKISGGIEVKGSYDSLVKEFDSSLQIEAIGGDPKKGNSGDPKNVAVWQTNYENWANSIPDFPNLAGLDIDDDLVPISSLVNLGDATKTAARKKEIEDAAVKFMDSHNVNILDDTIKQTQTFYLVCDSGLGLTKNYSGAKYYYPTMEAVGYGLEPLNVVATDKGSTGSIADPLESGTGYVFYTNNQKSTYKGKETDWYNYANSNYLAVFGEGVVYWNDQAAATWKFILLDKDTKRPKPGNFDLRAGDKVRIQSMNPSYSTHYLWSRSGSPTTGASDDMYNADITWTIKLTP